MGSNKHTRKVIAAKLINIADHEEKIMLELQKSQPDLNLIRKWEKDIHSFEAEIAKYSRRLPGGRR